MALNQLFPIAKWLPKYRKQGLRGDLSAGLSVGVMLVPQGMAYAMLAGLPPIYGLYASTIPLLIYAVLGSSGQLSVGPVAMASLLLASGLGDLINLETEPTKYLEMTMLLTLMVGVIRLLLGIMRLGFLVNFLSTPVIAGYTSAAALIIAFSQLKHLLGIKIPNSNFIHEVVYYTALNITHANSLTIAIGLGGIALLLSLKSIKKHFKIDIPAPLALVTVSTFLVWAMGLNKSGVAIVGTVPAGLPAFVLPNFSWETIQQLLPAATTIAIVGYMESIAVAKAMEAKHKEFKVSANQELIALGAANIGTAFFQGFPVNGGFSRTAVNEQAGAKTPLAGIFSAILVLFTLLLLTPLFYFMPQAVLASIVMVAVLNLIAISESKRLWKISKRDFWMLIITFTATLFVGVVEGILTGVLLSLGLLIYKSSMPHVAILGRIPGTPYYRNLNRFKNLEERADLLILRFDAELYFANASFFNDFIKDNCIKKGDQLKALILDAGSMNGIDSTAIYTVEELCSFLNKKGIKWLCCDAKGPLRDVLEKSGLVEKIGPDNFFVSLQDAVDAFDGKIDNSKKDIALQVNKENN
jgi:SulP family sulfate permease